MVVDSRQDGPVPPRLRIICFIAVMAALVGSCGRPVTAPATTTMSTTSTTSTTSTSPGMPVVFPVTITRTGGIAGFQDMLVVGGDGLVTVRRKGQPERRCQLSPPALQRLTRAATRLPWAHITPASPRASSSDQLVTTVESPAGGPGRLEDPLVAGAGKVLQDLVKNLSTSPFASQTCASP